MHCSQMFTYTVLNMVMNVLVTLSFKDFFELLFSLGRMIAQHTSLMTLKIRIGCRSLNLFWVFSAHDLSNVYIQAQYIHTLT